MTTQYQRAYTVQVDTIKFGTESPLEHGALDAVFNVVKDKTKEPNQCNLQVFNLSQQHRDQLADLTGAFVVVEAGYQDDVVQLYRGVTREIFSEQQGSDWVTTLTSGDGEKAFRRARVNESFAPGSKLPDVLRRLVRALKDEGVDAGNADQRITELQLSGKLTEAGNEFINGTVLSGKAVDHLDLLLRSVDMEWSIQDGEFQLLNLGQFLEGFAVVLNPDTGLVGAPSVGNDGILHGRALLNGTVVPGKQLQVESPSLPAAFYKCSRAEYLGDTSGQDWYVDFEAEILA